jgi:hypothetical protein
MTDKTYQHFFGGMIGGMFGTFISHPIDTMRVRLQTNQHIITDINNLKKQKPIYQASYILKDLYKGVKLPLIGIGLEKTLVFGSYHNIYKMNLFKNDFSNQIFAGTTAGFLTTIIVTPIERIKIMFQNNQCKNMIDCLSQINKNGNFVKNIYAGWTSTIFREIPGYGIYFYIYDLQKRKLKEPKYYQSFFMGGIAGATSWFFIYPIDIVKTKKQNDVNLNYVKIIKKIYNENGLVGFFRGISFSLMRAFPLHAGVFMGYEAFMKLF